MRTDKKSEKKLARTLHKCYSMVERGRSITLSEWIMTSSQNNNTLITAFVHGFLSVCTFGLFPSYLSSTEPEQVKSGHCKRPLTGSLGMLSDFRNISTDIVTAVRKLSVQHKA